MSGLSYVYVFLQSNFLELPIYIIFYCLFYLPKSNFKEVISYSTLTNLITHPIVFFVIMPLKLSYVENILWAEVFAVITEAFLHAWVFNLKFKKTILASSVANLVSWQIAPIITYWFFY